VEFSLFGPVYFLSGDNYPNDLHVDHELRKRLSPSFARWTSQQDIYNPTPGSFALHEFARREAHLETYLAAEGAGRDVVLVGRSSGARLATRYATRHPVAGVICLGYPFRNPAAGPELERYEHLAELTVPTLICQGWRDEYGGPNIFHDYAFSPTVRAHLFDGGHDLCLRPDAWDMLARLILEFCQEVLPRP
jgi:predicted alpha/beta-hydrolase family hydrolase